MIQFFIRVDASVLLTIAVSVHSIVSLSLLWAGIVTINLDTILRLLSVRRGDRHARLVAVMRRHWIINIFRIYTIVEGIHNLHLGHINQLLVLKCSHIGRSSIYQPTTCYLFLMLVIDVLSLRNQNLITLLLHTTTSWTTAIPLVVYLLLIIDVADHTRVHLWRLLIFQICCLSTHLNLLTTRDANYPFARYGGERCLVGFPLNKILY